MKMYDDVENFEKHRIAVVRQQFWIQRLELEQFDNKLSYNVQVHMEPSESTSVNKSLFMT